MAVHPNILLINETQNHSVELEIILKLAGYAIEVQSCLLAAKNLHSLLKGTHRAFDIVLMMSDKKNPGLNFFKQDGAVNIIQMASEMEGDQAASREDDEIRICTKKSLLETLKNCQIIAATQ